MSLENLYYYRKSEKLETPKKIERDVIIYGATMGGITAAVQLRRYGLSVAIAEFSHHVGGMTTSGLSATDLGSEHAVGGLAMEFYKEVSSYYGKPKEYKFEPKVARRIVQKWINEYRLEIFKEQHLESVVIENGAITEIVMENGNSFKGKVFIDSSYEGDLMAKAGVSYAVGRESNSKYHEIYNGIQFKEQHHKFETWIDPYKVEGKPESGLLYGIDDIPLAELGYNGKEDSTIQAYNFRICLTKDKENKVEFPKPKNYDSEKYQLLLRYILSGHWDAMKLNTPLPNNKWDLNNFGAFSTDHIGKNYKWPDGDFETREKIYQDHVEYNMGLLYFLANDKRVPAEIRKEVSQFGLPKDEFVETGHWPPQLYIREARRMISDYVMIDRNCLNQRVAEDSIGLASYHMDSHNCRRFVIDGRVVNEGDVEIAVSPFPISYRSIRPKAEECSNLLVPVAVSSSHIAFGSIRMEPVFMIIGQSAAVAAMIAIQNDTTVQNIDYKVLSEELEKVGQILKWDDSIKDDPVARMEATFGK